MSVKFVSAILGPETAAPILSTPEKKKRSFCGKTHVHKIPRFRGGGGVFWVLGGGGSADFIFMGRADFSDHLLTQNKNQITHLFSCARKKKKDFPFFPVGRPRPKPSQNPVFAGCLFSTRKARPEVPEGGDFGAENCLGKGGVDRAKKGKKDKSLHMPQVDTEYDRAKVPPYNGSDPHPPLEV